MKIHPKLLIITIAIAIVVTSVIGIFYYYVRYSGKVYPVGSRGPAGGWIFYDKGNNSDGWRYLEAAPEDLCASIRWNNGKEIDRDTGKLIITEATETAPGTGNNNTKKIIKTFGDGKYAAKLCQEYRGGGKNDWFLPSKDELDLMFKNLHSRKIGNFSDFYYWSSSETRLTDVYVKKISQHDFDALGKDFSPFAVCPVRAF